MQSLRADVTLINDLLKNKQVKIGISRDNTSDLLAPFLQLCSTANLPRKSDARLTFDFGYTRGSKLGYKKGYIHFAFSKVHQLIVRETQKPP